MAEVQPFCPSLLLIWNNSVAKWAVKWGCSRLECCHVAFTSPNPLDQLPQSRRVEDWKLLEYPDVGYKGRAETEFHTAQQPSRSCQASMNADCEWSACSCLSIKPDTGKLMQFDSCSSFFFVFFLETLPWCVKISTDQWQLQMTKCCWHFPPLLAELLAAVD